MIRLLVASEADINLADNDGETPLHWSVFGEQWKATQLLLGLGASPKLKNLEAMTPFQLACDEQAWRCMFTLLLKEWRTPLITHKYSSPHPPTSFQSTQTPPPTEWDGRV